MEQIALYKDFRIRAYENWSGQWFAEAKKRFDANPESTLSRAPVTQRQKGRHRRHKAADR